MEDLGIGTSSGHSYRAGTSSTAYSVATLLAQAPKFVRAQQTTHVEEIPYEPINAPAKLPSALPSSILKTTKPTNATVSPASPILAKANSLFFDTIDPAVSWHQTLPPGKGLHNLGNTCFLNSAIQVLIHTPPLARYLLTNKHAVATCPMRKGKGFCMTCTLAVTLESTFKAERSSSFAPKNIVNNLRNIAKHMRLGRQEDAHEFLRFCIDGMQLSSLYGKSPKLDIKIKESTFVHQIFGGRLRSRVVCTVCKHPSDTFDSILDLSLDVGNVDSIKEALAGFVKVDVLKGANKYKCEKCKKLVVAEKNFTIDQAPMVLTIHLKRFTASGRKIGDQIKYPELLNLGPYMSDPQSRAYRLFGVINHSGGGPHSGHYTANIRAANGSWYHMNDDSVSSTPSAPLNAKSAYVLFYCRERGDTLSSAIRSGPGANGVASTTGVNGNGKRGRESVGGAGGTPMKKLANGTGASPVALAVPTNGSPARAKAINPFLPNSTPAPQPESPFSSAFSNSSNGASPNGRSIDGSPQVNGNGKGKSNRNGNANGGGVLFQTKGMRGRNGSIGGGGKVGIKMVAGMSRPKIIRS